MTSNTIDKVIWTLRDVIQTTVEVHCYPFHNLITNSFFSARVSKLYQIILFNLLKRLIFLSYSIYCPVSPRMPPVGWIFSRAAGSSPARDKALWVILYLGTFSFSF